MTTSTTTGPPRSSIFDRIKSPFASKQNPQIKQDIQLDAPFREFAPGESIKGQIHLNVPKPTRATHLVVRLLGFVKVVTHSRLPGQEIPYDENLLSSSKGRRGGEYFGNGFAKLFEDEHVLCGDGRLFGNYVFQFEVLLPQQNTPSSIDFENGTITYLITSTLTKPTTISPTLVQHCKIKVKDVIDIARIPVPRPQTVSLETVKNRRPKIRIGGRTPNSTAARDQASETDGTRTAGPSSPLPLGANLSSPGVSEISSPSASTSSIPNSQSVAQPTAAQDARSMTSGMLSFTTSDKTITAQAEVLQGGCLPGDTIPIRVSVDHTKPIKSMQGIIVTLYRLARIDVHPALPLGPSDPNSSAKYEDYYPKSRTGLGGLSLSSAGSSRTFRQDIAQNIAPLIIDPNTLSAIVQTSIQVPEHVFPTIGGVPGSMISFKYYVETVIDLPGKLGQDRILPKFSMTNTPQHAYEEPKINVVNGKDGLTFSTTPGFNFLITDRIRRQKGVVYTKTEVLVGTLDSTRSHARGRSREVPYQNGSVRGRSDFVDDGPPTYQFNQRRRSSDYNDRNNADHAPPNSESWHFSPTLTRPEEPLDEKALIRRAEQTLLPSAPPESGSSVNGSNIVPSAPAAFDEDDFGEPDNLPAPAPSYQASSSSPQISGAMSSRLSPSEPTHPSSSSAVAYATGSPGVENGHPNDMDIHSKLKNAQVDSELNSHEPEPSVQAHVDPTAGNKATSSHKRPDSSRVEAPEAQVKETRYSKGAQTNDGHDEETITTATPADAIARNATTLDVPEQASETTSK